MSLGGYNRKSKRIRDPLDILGFVGFSYRVYKGFHIQELNAILIDFSIVLAVFT